MTKATPLDLALTVGAERFCGGTLAKWALSL
jgi:hypothetical protein